MKNWNRGVALILALALLPNAGAHALGIGSLMKSKGQKDAESTQKDAAFTAQCQLGLNNLSAGKADPAMAKFVSKQSARRASCGVLKDAAKAAECQKKAADMKAPSESADLKAHRHQASAWKGICESPEKFIESLATEFNQANEEIVSSIDIAADALGVKRGEIDRNVAERKELDTATITKGKTAKAVNATLKLPSNFKEAMKLAPNGPKDGGKLSDAIKKMALAVQRENMLEVVVAPHRPQSGGALSAAANPIGAGAGMFKSEPPQVKFAEFIGDDFRATRNILKVWVDYAKTHGIDVDPRADSLRPDANALLAGLGKIADIVKGVLTDDYMGVTTVLHESLFTAGGALGIKEKILELNAPVAALEEGTIENKHLAVYRTFSESSANELEMVSANPEAAKLSKESLAQIAKSKTLVWDAIKMETGLAYTSAMYGYAAASGDPGSIIAGVYAVMIGKNIPGDILVMKKIHSTLSKIEKLNNVKSSSDASDLLPDLPPTPK